MENHRTNDPCDRQRRTEQAFPALFRSIHCAGSIPPKGIELLRSAVHNVNFEPPPYWTGYEVVGCYISSASDSACGVLRLRLAYRLSVPLTCWLCRWGTEYSHARGK
jgi:hypothetical protein